MKQDKEIYFIHALNNFTGSPMVLAQVVKAFVAKGYRVTVDTSRGLGPLSDLDGVHYRYSCYRWSNNPFVTCVLLLLSQLALFCRLLVASKKRLYYINTIVPFGAMLACWLTNKHYVIHVHENMQQRKVIYRLFRACYRLCNRKSIFVSNYVAGTSLNCKDGVVIGNALSEAFYQRAQSSFRLGEQRHEIVLMVASLRRYKGIYEFVELAKRLPHLPFELVLSAEQAEVDLFISEVKPSANLKIFPLQSDLHPFYSRAKILLQLSHPDGWVETFGLTIIEAMAYGIPAIVPQVGGPAELVKEGENGMRIDAYDLDQMEQVIAQWFTDEQLYTKLSEHARKASHGYQEKVMFNQIENYII